MKRIDITELFENNNLYLFDESSYRLGCEYNNVEGCKVLYEVDLISYISPRKCKVLINDEVRTMYFSQSDIKISKNLPADDWNSYKIENVICTDSSDKALEIAHYLGYTRATH